MAATLMCKNVVNANLSDDCSALLLWSQVSGTFLCMDSQGMIKDVPQQFKYSPPTICRNPVCNNRARFHLDTHKSKFIDFQKVTAGEDA